MFWFKKRNFNKDDVKLLKEIRQVLKWIGLGDIYGLCGNNQSHLIINKVISLYRISSSI